MSHTLTVAYETVKYMSGTIGGAQPSTSVPGFADPAHYDSTKSSLSRPGGTASVFGQGGLIDAVAGGVEDLQALASGRGGLQNVLGAVQTAGTVFNAQQKTNILQSIGPATVSLLAGQAALAAPGLAKQVTSAGNAQAFPNAPKIGR
jgi:hypothetical protein